jgi:Xaa-Pro dipeptidase
MRAHQIDCAALLPGANLHYITGLDFHLMERPTILLIPSDGSSTFVLPALERYKVERAGLTEVRLFAYNDEQGPQEAARQAIAALPEVRSLAVEYLRMRVMELHLVQRYAPKAQLVDAGPVMGTLRLIKSLDEIDCMRRAIDITEQALAMTTDWVRPGVTEIQVAKRLSAALLEAGAGALPFEPIVLAGPNAAQPHGIPGDQKVQSGEVLLIDFGASKDGYVSDITRVFVVGKPPITRFQEIHKAVKAANAAGRAACKPGIACQEVDRAARRIIIEAGFGEYFTHRVGHGIGLEAHEGPYMVEGNEQLLEAGMTFTVEPGIYLPGEVGIRIEDDMLITPTGAESLTHFSREFAVIGA